MSDLALPDDILRALLRGDQAYLAQQSAAGRGYVVNYQHAYHAPAVPLQVPSEVPMAVQNNQFIVEEDVTNTLPDGRVEQIAVKGTALTLDQARRLGLLKDQPNSGPSEVKSAADLANAQAAQAMKENTGNPDAEAPSVVRERQTREATERAAQAAADASAANKKASKK